MHDGIKIYGVAAKTILTICWGLSTLSMLL